jgi:pentatricopeptide repeat protein
MFGLCKAQQTDRAIDFLAYMISKGCKPTEVSYTILIEGIANEGLAKEALELLNELCSRGVVKKSSAEQVVVRL